MNASALRYQPRPDRNEGRDRIAPFDERLPTLLFRESLNVSDKCKIVSSEADGAKEPIGTCIREIQE